MLISFFSLRSIQLQMVFRMIVNAVAQRRRFITVKGTPCIGKHTLLRQLACYALDRQRFTDGVLQISLRGLTSVGSIFDKIAKTAKLKLKSAKKVSKSLKLQVDETLAIVDEAESAVLSALRDRNVLLVFENAEDAYINDRKAFGYVMKTLHDGAQQVCSLFLIQITFHGAKPY
jgi:type II secretory pathway predicted ATPase ExeA